MASVAERGGRGIRLPAAPAGNAGMWIGGIVLALSNFMVVLDTSIANVSVPHIAGSLAISPDQGTWVITSYSVAEAITVPLTGWLASRFGTVRTYLFAMAGFGIFSVLCGLSESLGLLVAARVGQGICGGPIMPLTQTLLMRIFPPEKRGQAMGLWAMTTVVAPIAGPLTGGWISDNMTWHWIFFINIPVAIACVVGNAITLRGRETELVARPIDYVGLILLVIWVGALQIMLDIGRDHDWFSSQLVWTLAIVAGIGFCAFVIWELTEEQPIVDIRVFRHRGFVAASGVLALTYAAFFSSMVVTPQWLQEVMGYTASWSGAVTAWVGLFAVVMSQVVGRFSGRIDPRLIVFTGICWMALTMWLRSHWTSGADYWTLALPHLLQGIGMPMFFVPITVISLASVLPQETASAAGLFSFIRTLSGAVGTSVATTVWADNIQGQRAQLVNLIHLDPTVTSRLQDAGFSAMQMRGLLAQLVEQEGAVLSLTHFFQAAAVVLVLAGSTIWLVPKPGRKVDTSSAH